MKNIHCSTGTTYHLPNNTAVTLIDTMPTLGFYTYADGQQISHADARILWAARQSTRSTAHVASALTTYERDKKLYTRLWREHHSTPFEFVQVQLHVVCSLTTRSQWHRHRSASYNEYSRRYSEEWTEVQTPDWRLQSALNKQGSEGRASEDLQTKWDAAFAAFWQNAHALYTDALNDGIAREVARDFLPTSTLTRFAVSVNLRNLMGFLALRCAPDAQKEIQALACVIRDEMLSQISPWMCELITRE